MRGLDTNVLVRYLTQDDNNQSIAAERAIEEAVSNNEKLVIHPIVICELIWVLESAYGYRKKDILPVLDRIMQTIQFEFIDKDTIWQALIDFNRGRGDFADYYIGHANSKFGAQVSLTFDKSLKNSALFSLIQT